jgi:hypothetical protein
MIIEKIKELIDSPQGRGASIQFQKNQQKILADMRSNPDWSKGDIDMVEDAFQSQELMAIMVVLIKKIYE